MLKVENNEIKVYRNISKFLNKQSGNEEIEYSFSKDEFVIYKKEKVFKKYNTSNITSFSIFPSQYNEVVLNFINEKGKKDSRIFMMKGCLNTNFVKNANELLKFNFGVGEIQESFKTPDAPKEIRLKRNTKLINELMNTEEKIEVVFLGKTRLFVLNGRDYMYKKIVPELIYITEDNTILSFYTNEIEMDLSEISSDNQYILYFDKKKQCFFAQKDNKKIDLERINNLEKIRNSIDYKFNLTVDPKTIIQETELSKRIYKVENIFRIILIISVLLCLTLLIFHNKTIVQILFTISILLLIYYPVVLLVIVKKYKEKIFK